MAINKETASRKEKVTLTLPQHLMNAVRELAPPRGYSQFISQALAFYLEDRRQQNLEAQLIAGYQANAERDQIIATEWSAVENEVWRGADNGETI